MFGSWLLFRCATTCFQQVTHEMGKSLADEYGIRFFETSAKNNINVEEAFMCMAKDIVER